MIQTLELISQSEFKMMRGAELDKKLMTPRFEYIKNQIKNGRMFTDESPMYKGYLNGTGDIVLSHGIFKCQIELIK